MPAGPATCNASPRWCRCVRPRLRTPPSLRRPGACCSTPWPVPSRASRRTRCGSCGRCWSRWTRGRRRVASRGRARPASWAYTRPCRCSRWQPPGMKLAKARPSRMAAPACRWSRRSGRWRWPAAPACRRCSMRSCWATKWVRVPVGGCASSRACTWMPTGRPSGWPPASRICWASRRRRCCRRCISRPASWAPASTCPCARATPRATRTWPTAHCWACSRRSPRQRG